MTPNTHASNADEPDAAENDGAYPYFLRNRKNNKKNMTLNTDAPDNDAPNAADNDAASPDSLIIDSSIKRKIDPDNNNDK